MAVDDQTTMRVLHLHSGNLYGGVETFLLTLARCRHLRPSMEMTVALCFEGRIASELRAEDVPTLILGAVRLRRPDSIWRARRRLATLLQHGRFDVAVCHQAWPYVVFGPTIRAAEVPIVLWVHTAGNEQHWLNRWGRRNQPDRIVCNSRFTMSMLPAGGGRAEYIYCPVLNLDGHPDASDRARVRAELGTAPHDVVIIQVGRMEPLKGHTVCIEALARLRDLPGWTCWQVGGPQQPPEVGYFNELREAAARLGVADRIRFVGERSDVGRLLQAADIYCQPNTEPEGFGLTFVEALSAGLPVVTSALGGAVEVVNDQCGVLVPPRDFEAVARALRHLIADPELRGRLRHHALARRKALCDPREQMERIAGLLEDVSAQSRRQSVTGSSLRHSSVSNASSSSGLRLAVFSYGLPVPGRKRGGIERAAHTLADGLARRGHRVVVFTHDPRPELARYEVRGLPWKRFVDSWFGRRMTMGYLGNVLAVLPDYRDFDAVIAYGDSLLLALSSKPVLRVMLGSALGEAIHARSIGRIVLQLGVYLQELATALIERTVGISENTRRYNPFVRVVIPLGVDAAVFSPKPEEKTLDPSLIFVGTADGRKRGRLLVDIFQKAVRPLYPNAILMFVGPQDEALPGVTYYTGISDTELASLYRRAWIYASPSQYEGFGLPYLEAMACGTPVVATPNPGSLEVLGDGEYGRLVDDETFTSTLLDLLRNEAARRAIAAAGLRRANQYSLELMLDRYEALLMELCKVHAGTVASA